MDLLYYWLLLLCYPIAWIVFKLRLTALVGDGTYRRIMIVLALGSAMILFSPVSFYGHHVDFAVLLATLVAPFAYGLRTKRQEKKLGAFLVRTGQASLLIPCGLALVLFLNPFYYAYHLYPDAWEVRETNAVPGGRLDHFVTGVNFTYPGTHTIRIKKDLIPYVLERNVGEVNLGEFDQFNLPSYTFTLTMLQGKERNQPRVIHETQYDLTQSALIRKKYDVEAGKYVIVQTYPY